MVNQIKVIAKNNLPPRYPISSTLLVIMAADFYNLSQLWHGVIYAMLGICWVAIIYRWATTEEVDIFKTSPTQKENG